MPSNVPENSLLVPIGVQPPFSRYADKSMSLARTNSALPLTLPLLVIVASFASSSAVEIEYVPESRVVFSSTLAKVVI